MLKHWKTVHSEEQGGPQFRFQIVRFCKSALERQIGEATRISLRGNCLNSRAGYNRSGVTRLTLRPEDAPTKTTGRDVADRLIKEGEAAMEKRAGEKAKNIYLKGRKRGGEEKDDLNKRNSKKMRKLKHRVEDSDWGLDENEIDELERKELERSRFLQADRTWAKIGTNQTRIRIWTAPELEARKMIIDCSKEACERAETRKDDEIRREATEWLETAPVTLEFDDIPAGWKDQDPWMASSPPDDDTVLEGWRAVDTLQDGWNQDENTKKFHENMQGTCKLKLKFKQENITKYFKHQGRF